MAVNTFGRTPAEFAEYPDPGNPGQMLRPPEGQIVKVRDLLTQAPLPDITTTQYGYLETWTSESVLIEISGDGGITWRGPIPSREALTQAITSGTIATEALTVATAADTKATQALASSASAGVTIAGVGPATVFSLAQIGARAVSDPIPSSAITGIATVATSGQGKNLTDFGQPGGVPTLGSDGKIPAAQIGGVTGGGTATILQNPDGSWPARSTVTTDATRRVDWDPFYAPTQFPAIAADGIAAAPANPVAGIPGDRVIVRGQ
jgi:hypothetical protein